MFEDPCESFILEIPPWPEFIMGSYRFFDEQERHVTRICGEFVLLFMLERALYFSENGHPVKVEAGEWYIQVPGLRQEGWKGSPAPVYYYIHFNGCGSPGAGERRKPGLDGMKEQEAGGYLHLPVRGRFEPEYFRPLLDQLERLTRRHPSDILGRQALFLTILGHLSAPELFPRDREEHLAAEVMDFLAENYRKPLSGEKLTEKFHFSSDYLTRKMKRYAGITPWQYVQQLRIGHAKELLANTDYTLSCIGNEVGYQDLSVFYKAFRKQTGEAPGVWRQKTRGMPGLGSSEEEPI